MMATDNEMFPTIETRVNNTRIDVLEAKIKIDSTNHEKEKRKITSEKVEAVKSLEAENEDLKIEVASKSDQIRQLDIANDKKEFLLKKNNQKMKELRQERDELKQQVDDLQREISRLEDTRNELSKKFQDTIITVEKQQEELTMMERKINDLKEKLALVQDKMDARDDMEKQLLSQMKSVETKLEETSKDAKIREKKLELKMKEMEKKRDEEAERLKEERKLTEAKRDEDTKRIYQMFHEKLEVLGENLKCNTDIQKEIRENLKPEKEGVMIKKSKNLQIHNGNHYYMGHVPQSEAPSRGTVNPLKCVPFPGNTDISQPI